LSEKSPWQLIQEASDLRSTWSDEAIMAEIQTLPVLPDEYNEDSDALLDDSHWMDPELQEQLTIYLALVKVVSEHKLRAAVPLLMERVSYGDMGETMRGVWGSLASAYDNKIEWEDLCFQMAQSPYRGVRLWMMQEIALIRDEHSLAVLIKGLHDTAPLVRECAAGWLEFLCQDDSLIRERVLDALRMASRNAQSEREQRNLKANIQAIENMFD
jgi:hypothetical protein